MKDERTKAWDRAVTDFLLAIPDTPESKEAWDRAHEEERKRLETEGTNHCTSEIGK
jgi:hypothetical protein